MFKFKGTTFIAKNTHKIHKKSAHLTLKITPSENNIATLLCLQIRYDRRRLRTTSKQNNYNITCFS